MKLPLYKARINSNDCNTGVYTISLVQEPATEKDWVTFSKDEPKQAFKFSADEQRMVRGVIMVADTPIYRRNGDYEYYLTFDRDTLKVMAQKLLRMGYQNNLNTDHQEGTWVNGMLMQEIFIKDSTKGINPEGFDDVPDGSLMATYYVDSEDIWSRIKEGTWSGFSLEGFFDIEQVEPSDDEVDEVLQLIERLKNKLK